MSLHVGKRPGADGVRFGVQVVLTNLQIPWAIPDVGQAAVFKSYSSAYATASALVMDRYLQVTLDGIDARDRKGQLIELLKSAVSRL